MNKSGAMITFEQALATVLASARPLGTEAVPLEAAHGRVLGADVLADADQPPFDKSAMDGFACRRADLPGPLLVTESIAAGAVPRQPVTAGRCARIMTGAPIPAGADCVVPFEQAEELADQRMRCTVASPKTNICRQGEDIRQGDVVLERGAWLGAPQVAVLASVGCASVTVARRPRVVIMATGDELVACDAAPGPGQIRNSNGPQLAVQVAAAGGLPIMTAPVSDAEGALREAIAAALTAGEVVLLSGGVSAGDFDLVPAAMRACGLEILFDSIAVKPGRPTTFAVRDGSWCLGLPGNPVSTLLQCELLVRPLLAALMGADPAVRTVAARLGEVVTRRGAARQALLPVRLDREGIAWPVAYHGSAHIHAFCRADGFIVVPAGVTHLDKGALVHVRPVPAAH